MYGKLSFLRAHAFEVYNILKLHHSVRLRSMLAEENIHNIAIRQKVTVPYRICV